MIAIVHSQPTEAQEYREYIAYLQNTGYIKGDMEAYNLNDLEGAQGLKALRVAVNLDEASSGQNLNSDDLEAIVDAMPQGVTER